jgi:hypothetical protein
LTNFNLFFSDRDLGDDLKIYKEKFMEHRMNSNNKLKIGNEQNILDENFVIVS